MDPDEQQLYDAIMRQQQEHGERLKHASPAELLVQMQALSQRSMEQLAHKCRAAAPMAGAGGGTSTPGRDTSGRLSPPDGPVAQGPASTIPLPTPPEPVLADLSSMLGRETYPTWIHAADADVASRQGRLEARIEDLDASVSLLHTKMETIIGQLAAREPEKEETMPTTKHWTSKDLETFPDDGTRYEIIDGDLYVSHQPSWHHQYTCSQLIYVLQAWSHTTSLGAATGAPGLIFAEDQDVAPDVVWISHTRLQGTLDQAGHLTRAPELVIEVLSPGSANVRRDREVKLSLYSRRSVDEYWIVDPVAQTIDVYRQQAGRLAHVDWLTREDTLTSPGLPGFTCAVAGLFDTRTMSPRSP